MDLDYKVFSDSQLEEIVECANTITKIIEDATGEKIFGKRMEWIEYSGNVFLSCFGLRELRKRFFKEGK